MKGIIFDLDGTLWDSRESVAKAWNQAIARNSSLPVRVDAKRLGKLFGKPMEVIFNQLFPDSPGEERERLAEACCAYENERLLTDPGVLYENVAQTIGKLSASYPLFIVSNCQEGYIQAFLQVTGLGKYFKDFTSPGETGRLKADNIRIIMDRNALTEAVYVGDTQGDCDASEEAGIPFVYASYGLGEVMRSWHSITKFEELLTIMEKKTL